MTYPIRLLKLVRMALVQWILSTCWEQLFRRIRDTKLLDYDTEWWQNEVWE